MQGKTPVLKVGAIAASCIIGIVCCGALPLRGLVQSVFLGFTYVGTDASTSLQEPAHELPASFASGIRYMFLLPRTAANVGQWTTFKKRLEDAGAHVERAPQSGGDLANISVGGPLFKIDFRYKGRRGSIFNEIEPRVRSNERLSHEWLLERYVLQFEN